MNNLNTYIIEKLKINKDTKINNIEELIKNIVSDFFLQQKIKYTIELNKRENGRFIQVNIIMNKIYKENLVDNWCVKICELFEKELNGWYWGSRSTKFDNPKNSIITILLGKR